MSQKCYDSKTPQPQKIILLETDQKDFFTNYY